jgi:hypothetical protein
MKEGAFHHAQAVSTIGGVGDLNSFSYSQKQLNSKVNQLSLRQPVVDQPI